MGVGTDLEVILGGGRVQYPASYLNGPLGNENILPGSEGAFLIGFYGGAGVSWEAKKSGFIQRETDMGRAYDGMQVQYTGDQTYMGVPNCIAPSDVANRMEEWIDSRGSFACATWSPSQSIDDVNSGSFDTGAANVADHFASYAPIKVMLRLWHEFDNPGTPYTPPGGAAGGPDFIEAWQRIVGIFQAQGATNVGFWWCPNEGYVRTTVNASYPGDAYVDWVGSDSYNWCSYTGTGCYSTPLHSGEAQFDEIFDYPPDTVPGETSQHDLWGPSKPFVIAETGTILDATQPTTWKGDWFRAIPAAAQNMSYLRGISFYDQDVSAFEGAGANFRVDAHPTSNADAYDGFKELAADPWFNTGTPL